MNEKKPKLLWLDNPTIWRNARGISLGLIVLVSPLIYFGIINNFTLKNFLNFEFGGLIVYMTFVNLLTTFEVRSRAFEDELDYDNSIEDEEHKSIVDMEIEIKDNAVKIRPNITKGIKVLSIYNKQLQLSYNEQKTTLIIDKLKSKQDNINIKLMYSTKKIWFIKITLRTKWLTWRLHRKTKKIDKLSKIPKRDKRFKPYRFNSLISTSGVSKYTRVGDKETKSNPKKVPFLTAVLKMPIKGFTMSLGGFFVMLFFVDDPLALFKFYLWFLLVVALTVISQYIITRYKTKRQYKYSLKVIKYLQDKVIEGINKEESNVPMIIEG